MKLFTVKTSIKSRNNEKLVAYFSNEEQARNYRNRALQHRDVSDVTGPDFSKVVHRSADDAMIVLNNFAS